jgi:hypothetical protein
MAGGLLDFLFSGGQGGGLLGNMGQPQPINGYAGMQTPASMGQGQLIGPSGNPYPGGMDPMLYASRALQASQPSPGILQGGNFMDALRSGLGQIADPQGQRSQEALRNYIALKQLGIQEKAAEEKPQIMKITDQNGVERIVLIPPYGKAPPSYINPIDPATGTAAPPQSPINLPPGADVPTARKKLAEEAITNQQQAVQDAKTAASGMPLLEEARAAYKNAMDLGAIGPYSASKYIGRPLDEAGAALEQTLGLPNKISTPIEAARQRYDKAMSALQLHANPFKGQGAVSNFERSLASRQYPGLTAINPQDQLAVIDSMIAENKRTVEAGKIPSLGQAPQVGAVLNRGEINPGNAMPAPQLQMTPPQQVQQGQGAPIAAPAPQGAPAPQMQPATPAAPQAPPVRVTSMAQARALPPDTLFIDPNGIPRRTPPRGAGMPGPNMRGLY